MKTTELMLGDWVRFPETNDDGESNVKIICVCDDGWGYDFTYVHITGCDNPIGLDEIEPIPLTPEILEKNGYTCKRSLDKEIISYNWTSPDRRVTLNDQNGSPWFCIIRSDGMMEEVMIGITYVHELQHALRLCGIEKEIVL